ncbi:MAG TPA: hypothetical protein PLZ45_01170 [Ferruginibacter sp.]|nr:hypothetical protein [Chitinophagaceae bacterium]HRI23247.1 hypothetical protein [Ferruginibacter sp.]
MKKIFPFLLLCLLVSPALIKAQDVHQLVEKVKARIETVKDYTASGKMKTNVSFLKVPLANVVIYFRRPNQLKIKNEKGISFVPKGAVSINLNNIISSGSYTALDAGQDKLNSIPVRVVKLLPSDENAEVVLSTLYIDEARLVILKTRTTTRDNGSYELEMSYGNYTSYGLPDKIIFSFNTKEYKLPKGVTFDFDDGSGAKPEKDKTKNRKGRAEITIHSYTINKGLADDVFK